MACGIHACMQADARAEAAGSEAARCTRELDGLREAEARRDSASEAATALHGVAWQGHTALYIHAHACVQCMAR